MLNVTQAPHVMFAKNLTILLEAVDVNHVLSNMEKDV